MPVTPILGYGKRTGVTTLKKAVVALCNLWDKYKQPIKDWIQTNTTEEKAASVIAALDDMQVACDIIRIIPDD